MYFCYCDNEYYKVIWIINTLVHGNLIVHTSAEPTQILAMGINVGEVMLYPT